MKTDRSCVISGTSLFVSLVCLAGILHVEYRLYAHEQMQSEHVQTTGGTEKTLEKELENDLRQETVNENQQPGKCAATEYPVPIYIYQ